MSNPFSPFFAEIVHRDLNLENILLEENRELDQMKIIDFGLACRYEDGVKLTDLVGKGRHSTITLSRVMTQSQCSHNTICCTHSTLRCP